MFQVTWAEKLSLLIGKIKKKKETSQETKEKTKVKSRTFMELVKATMVGWAQESTMQDPVLIREIFQLLYRRFNGIGEVTTCNFYFFYHLTVLQKKSFIFRFSFNNNHLNLCSLTKGFAIN